MTPAGLAKEGDGHGHGGSRRPAPDLYQLLGVPREAFREGIAQAWRRRARDEHPDRRPGEAADEAAARFRSRP